MECVSFRCWLYWDFKIMSLFGQYTLYSLEKTEGAIHKHQETEIPRENHWPAISYRQTLSHNFASNTPRHGRDSNSHKMKKKKRGIHICYFLNFGSRKFQIAFKYRSHATPCPTSTDKKMVEYLNIPSKCRYK
jgi:hypothetical protein